MAMREPLFSMLPRPEPVKLAGRRVLVLGLGDSGLSAARWVQRQGGIVRAADTRASPPRAAHYAGELRTGEFDASLLDAIDLVCISPGLPLEQPIVREAIALRIPVLGDIELFAWHVRATQPGARIVAITGTNGKTTVTALTGHLLRSAGQDAEVAGNIGPAALDALAGRSTAPACWVLELSSYQLETTWSLAADAATVLNLSEDHLDRYAGQEDYAAAKARVYAGAGNAVLNRGLDAAARSSAPTFGLDAPPREQDFGVVVHDGGQWLARGGSRLLRAADLQIAGAHNLANALAALALCEAVGVPAGRVVEGLRSFRGLPHRLERVASQGGVTYYDDSKGTNVGAAVAAMQGLGGTVVLIAGGDGKRQDFAPLAQAAAKHARTVLLIGRDAPAIAAALAAAGVAHERCDSLERAVARAAQVARPGDAVLLSPACASFDMFRDYKHRGEVFAATVRALGRQA
jgi:UDP-N-acetylmuramoylalanine--D-glutamate ligase